MWLQTLHIRVRIIPSVDPLNSPQWHGSRMVRIHTRSVAAVIGNGGYSTSMPDWAIATTLIRAVLSRHKVVPVLVMRISPAEVSRWAVE